MNRRSCHGGKEKAAALLQSQRGWIVFVTETVRWRRRLVSLQAGTPGLAARRKVSGRGKRKAPRAVSGREGGLVASSLLVFCFRFCSARRESHFRFEFKQQGGAAAGDGGRPGPGEGFFFSPLPPWCLFVLASFGLFFSFSFPRIMGREGSLRPVRLLFWTLEKEASGLPPKAKSLWQAPFLSPHRDRLIYMLLFLFFSDNVVSRRGYLTTDFKINSAAPFPPSLNFKRVFAISVLETLHISNSTVFFRSFLSLDLSAYFSYLQLLQPYILSKSMCNYFSEEQGASGG